MLVEHINLSNVLTLRFKSDQSASRSEVGGGCMDL